MLFSDIFMEIFHFLIFYFKLFQFFSDDSFKKKKRFFNILNEL